MPEALTSPPRPHLVELDSPDLTRLRAAPRFALARWPTPIDEGSVLVKRDDLSGFGRGGAKARKLEHLIGYLLAGGHDELITVAGNVTNLAFDFMPAVDRAKLRLHLLILNDPPANAANRALIFDGIHDRVELKSASHWAMGWAAARAYLASRRAGYKPFLVLPGISHPAGVIGNACGFVEMVEQLRREGRPLPRTVFVTAATGTTVAGFSIAAEVLRRAGCQPIRVIGVQVYPGAIRRWTWALVRWTERHLGLDVRVPAEHIEIDSSALAGGFGHFTAELAGCCHRVQVSRGIKLDPMFGGKTWTAMESFAARSTPGDGPILYWHCGYTPEWQVLGQRVNLTSKAGR